MGKLHIAGISEPINMPDEQLQKSVLNILETGHAGKSTLLSAATGSGTAVLRITPESSFLAEFDDPEFASFLQPDEDAE